MSEGLGGGCSSAGQTHPPTPSVHTSCGHSHPGAPRGRLGEVSHGASLGQAAGMSMWGARALAPLKPVGGAPPLPLLRAGCPSEDLGNGADSSHTGPRAAGEPCSPLSGAAGDSAAQGLGLGGAHASAPPPSALWPCPGLRGKQLVEKHPKPTCSLCSMRDKHPSVFHLSIHPSIPKYLLSICYMHDTILNTKV